MEVQPDLQIVSVIVAWLTAGFRVPGAQVGSGSCWPLCPPSLQVPGASTGLFVDGTARPPACAGVEAGPSAEALAPRLQAAVVVEAEVIVAVS